MVKILNAGLIGTGSLSTKRIYPYLSSAGMKVKAVTAIHLDHAAEKCDLYGGRPYTNWHQMIEQERPDVVIACVGPELHYEAAKFCKEKKSPFIRKNHRHQMLTR